MKHKWVLMLVLVFLSTFLVSAQDHDDAGNSNDPHDNDIANACLSGGSMAGKCGQDTNGDRIVEDWEVGWAWSCGWYLIRFEAGMLSRDIFPAQCSSLLPPLPPPSETSQSPSMPAGCYDSSGGDFDFTFNGQINQPNNAAVNTSTNGSCSGFAYNATIVYFVGLQADALLFCQSIKPGASYIENSLARGYPVPNQYFWGCA